MYGNYENDENNGVNESNGINYRRQMNYGGAYNQETNRVNLNHIPEEPKKKEKKKGIFGRIVAACVCGILFGVFAGSGIYAVSYFAQQFQLKAGSIEKKVSEAVTESEPTKAPEVKNEAKVIGNEGQNTNQVQMTTVMDATAVVDKCMPSIVSITNMFTEVYQGFWGQREKVQNESSGSGIIVGENDTELLIVTNSHVISDSDQLTVQFVDGESYIANVKGSKSDQDIAIIAVRLEDMKPETREAISIATLGDSTTLKVGEPAIAIGNALGYGQSVTSGIISAVERDSTIDNVTRKVIQTDAAINPGNSGGALLNIRGELIGINEYKYASAKIDGMGFAIPISVAKPIIDDLMQKTTRTQVDENESAYLGISGVNVSEQVASMYGMPIGVYVAQVIEGTAAQSAGLVKGDIITEFDGETIGTMEELVKILSYYPAGTAVELKIQRMGGNGYEEMVVPVTLGKKVDAPKSEENQEQEEESEEKPAENEVPKENQEDQEDAPQNGYEYNFGGGNTFEIPFPAFPW